MSSVFARSLVATLVTLLLPGRLAAEQGPTWLALGAPFRVADSGTVVNGDTEKKLPLYDRLVPEVYQFADRHRVQEGVLRFVPHPRWFTGVGPVKGSGDLPLVDQGASLSFSITPLEKGQLKFELGIEGKEREVLFQVEHRRNDITPFLFAFTADDEAVDAKLASGGVSGGVTLMNVLMGKGERKDFSFTIDPKEVLALAGERKVTALTVVAAFCERRQEFTTGGIGMVVGKDSGISFVEGEDEAADFRKGEVPPIIGEDGEKMGVRVSADPDSQQAGEAGACGGEVVGEGGVSQPDRFVRCFRSGGAAPFRMGGGASWIAAYEGRFMLPPAGTTKSLRRRSACDPPLGLSRLEKADEGGGMSQPIAWFFAFVAEGLRPSGWVKM